jgi:hypothetical protein
MWRLLSLQSQQTLNTNLIKKIFKSRNRGNNRVEDIIERLKEEKSNLERASFANGKTEGNTWAKSAHYSKLTYAANYRNNYEHIKECQLVFDDDILGEYFQSLIEDDHPLADDPEHREYFDHCSDYWIRGWLEGVYEFWSQVADKI